MRIENWDLNIGQIFSLSFQYCVKPGITRPAHDQAYAVPQDCRVAVFSVELELRKTIDIQNIRSMNSDELGGVEAGFDLGESLLLQEPFSLGMKAHVIILRFDIVDLRHRNDIHVRAIAYGNTLEMCARRTRQRAQLCGCDHGGF